MDARLILAVLLKSIIVSDMAAAAANITRSGETIFVSGRLEGGDDLKFDAVAPQGSYRVVNLSSIGGILEVAGPIARNIKATGAVTIYDAARGVCSSSCTILFVAGRQRHYINSENIKEGIGRQGKRGLGFHAARSFTPGNEGRSMAVMTSIYYEMGVPAAVELSSRSPNRTVYYISSSTAIEYGVATSLVRP